ncbi:SoxR reducing system RseC family protein [candidate division WOR-3 bacterium]|nr:SoxR reducing system RseC family protein [candidate division WOR-3 bacterium]
MAKKGLVVEVNKNRATVILEDCKECNGCEFSRFCSVGKGGNRIVCYSNSGVKVGDMVSVDSKTRSMLLAGVINFVIPIILIIAGSILGTIVWGSELIGFLLTISLIIFYFLILTHIDRRIILSGKIIPEVLSVIKSGEFTICAFCGKTIKINEGLKNDNLIFCSAECTKNHLSHKMSEPRD